MPFKAAQNPRNGRNPHASLTPTSPSTQPLATNSQPGALPDHQPGLSRPGDPVSAPEDRVLGPNPNPRLGFQASVPRDLAPKPSRMGNSEPHPRTPPATLDETVPFRTAQKLGAREDCMPPLRPPHLWCPTGLQTRRLRLSQVALPHLCPWKAVLYGSLAGAAGA